MTTRTEIQTPFLEINMKPFTYSTYEEILEQQGTVAMPDLKSLDALVERIQTLLKETENRGTASDRGMRLMSKMEKIRELEEKAAAVEEGKLKREEEEDRGRKSIKIKRKKDVPKEERPLATGAHGVAPQDGSNIGTWFLLWRSELLRGCASLDRL
jgi:transcriptional adapter 3